MTQADKVLKHLKKRKKLTSVEAFGLYGISRLAAVVHRLKESGCKVISKNRTGVNARYTEYTLGK